MPLEGVCVNAAFDTDCACAMPPLGTALAPPLDLATGDSATRAAVYGGSTQKGGKNKGNLMVSAYKHSHYSEVVSKSAGILGCVNKISQYAVARVCAQGGEPCVYALLLPTEGILLPPSNTRRTEILLPAH